MSVTVEQARRISEAAGVDVIAALSALERNNGDALAAMLELERQGLTPTPPAGGFYSTRHGGVRIVLWSDLKEALKNFFHSCLATRLEVWRRGWQAASVPLLILVVLLLFFFLEITVVLGVGLLLGFRYRLSGPLVEGETVQSFFSSLREAIDRFLARLRRP